MSEMCFNTQQNGVAYPTVANIDKQWLTSRICICLDSPV